MSLFDMFSSNKDNGKSVEELIRLGYTAHQNKEKFEAIKSLEEALKKIDAHSPKHILNELFNIKLFLGVNHKRAGNYQKAYSYYLDILKLVQHPDDACEAHNAMGKISYLSGRRDEAIRHYLSALENANDENIKMNLLHHLGHAVLDLGDARHIPVALKPQIVEYRKSINGEAHNYDSQLVQPYVQHGLEAINPNRR
ncbi:tetratricopeptide repeat protein [Exiguobacterium sp. s26]|uniref:tetratricopeptide repeat protein n=1 Tax=Exiguobacterium sp. s26 TaxID=2751231 RepID=UPI001BEC7F22|nr:tetratricopeptide repeat protein [Exiguobacterium sp. s26]